MTCFICDLRSTPNVYNINKIRSKYRNIPLTEIIYEFIGNSFEINVSDDAVICGTCKLLLDTIDEYNIQMENIENLLMKQIRRTYKLNDDETQICTLDAETIKLFTKGSSENRFSCVECTFQTNIQDCLIPHSWMHTKNQERTTVSRNNHHIADHICFHCNLSFPNENWFQSHNFLFHLANKELANNGNSYHLEIEPHFNTTSDMTTENKLETEEFSGLEYKENDEEVFEEKLDSVDDSELEKDDSAAIFKCDKCVQIFDSRKQQLEHFNIKHYFVCKICKRICRNEITLKSHIKNRHTEHICDICGKKLSSLSSYRAHQSTHGTGHKLKCSYCNKGFRSKSLLATHIVIHTKEYNYTCHICGQKFIHQRSHRMHVQWHTNPRPHSCTFCQKTFTHRSHLAVHRRSHLGELPNGCKECDKRFSSSSKLKIHMVKHTGVYSHPCQVCAKGYMKRYKLAEHMFVAHGDNTMLMNKPKCEYKIAVRPDFINSSEN